MKPLLRTQRLHIRERDTHTLRNGFFEQRRILKEFIKLPKYVEKVINIDYKNIDKSIYKNEDIYYIGRGIDIYTCYEASLKLKEISYIHSECFSAGELKHGPIALISKGTPVIALLSEFSVYEKTISNIIEAKSRGAKIITIRKESINIDKNISDFDIVVPLTSEYIQNLVIMVACQMLSYEVALLRKCDIDKPRNLAKSVTVEQKNGLIKLSLFQLTLVIFLFHKIIYCRYESN